MRVSQTTGVRTHRDSTVLISDHPSSPVNFPHFLVPGKFGKFGKFASHRLIQSALTCRFCRLVSDHKAPRPSQWERGLG